MKMGTILISIHSNSSVNISIMSSKQQNKGGSSKNSKANINDTRTGALRAGIMSRKQRTQGGTGRSSKININDTCASALGACTDADSEVPQKNTSGAG
jgi:hypothetical protein